MQKENNFIYRTSKFLIISLLNNEKLNFQIQEDINLESFIEDSNKNRKFQLIGVIFLEMNQRLNYSTVFRNSDQSWILFNNEAVYTHLKLNEYSRNKCPKILIYKNISY